MLNSSQSKGLANLFFDLAKGFILGGLGFTATNINKYFSLVIIIWVSTCIFVFTALSLLKNIKNDN